MWLGASLRDGAVYRRAWASCLLLWSAPYLSGCESGNVGAPCIPDAEYSTEFSPFAIKEVYFESRSFQCETRVCLVNHFQGRVSCPLGQADADDEGGCYLPASTDASDRVVGPVPAWDLDRPPSRAVYCSCRCDGPDPNARYCECPSGFTCQELAPDVTSGKDGLKGSYCVKRGTEYDPVEAGGPTCADAPGDARCAEEI